MYQLAGRPGTNVCANNMARSRIAIPRPRDTFALKTTDEFHRHFNAVWDLLAEEVVDS